MVCHISVLGPTIRARWRLSSDLPCIPLPTSWCSILLARFGRFWSVREPNDGGTARDKAARFTNLRAEGMRLGGVPVFAVLGGLGWLRVNDTLGPVVAACDGRVFTLGTLTEMLGVAPISGLVNTP